MKIAVAQIKSLKGNILANIEKHIQFIELAVLHQADAVFFPELSITGYEPKLAKELVVYVYDKRFDKLQAICDSHHISIGVGVPIQFSTGIQISMIIFVPDRTRYVYSKQLLHSDELPYFTAGEKQLILSVNDKKIAPAICYESLQAEHAQKAHALGAEFYVASVAKPQTGMDKAQKHYPEVAKKYAMPVLMANAVGVSDDFTSVGKSAVWNKQGILLGQMNETEEGVLIFDSDTEQLIVKTI